MPRLTFSFGFLSQENPLPILHLVFGSTAGQEAVPYLVYSWRMSVHALFRIALYEFTKVDRMGAWRIMNLHGMIKLICYSSINQWEQAFPTQSQ